MSNKYQPDPIGNPQSISDLVAYLVREHQRISNALNSSLPQELEELHQEPRKKREGLLAVADGEDWNPGSGRGIYVWAGAVWTLIRAMPPRNITVPPPDDPEEPEEPPDTGEGPGTPAEGIATPTIHSCGIVWAPPSAPSVGQTFVQFRTPPVTGAWFDGYPMWYDAERGESRGSLVHLQPNTEYEVRMGIVNNVWTHQLTFRTWRDPDNFPVAAQALPFSGGTRETLVAAGVEDVASGNNTPKQAVLDLNTSGTATAYRLYDFTGTNTTVRAPNQNNRYAVVIRANFVILRGLNIRGGRHAIFLEPGIHDVVIDRCDISDWGRPGGVQLPAPINAERGTNGDAAIRMFSDSIPTLQLSRRIIIQRNRIYDPRYATNSWDMNASTGVIQLTGGGRHPAGPYGIRLRETGGNHVIRYNELFATTLAKYVVDWIGGEEDFSLLGAPGADSDVYGNLATNAMDDPISIEGGGNNVRVWQNYTDQGATGISSTPVSMGPCYIFRNVHDRHRFRWASAPGVDNRGVSYKAAHNRSIGPSGRRFVFHNTMLQRDDPDSNNGLGAGEGIGLSDGIDNTVTRNNIFHTWHDNARAISAGNGLGNDFNYDLYNGPIAPNYTGAEANGIRATPVYKSGHGAVAGSGGRYQLEPGTNGVDDGQVLSNFNDARSAWPSIGAAPDMGAHEEGSADMTFGVNSNAR